MTTFVTRAEWGSANTSPAHFPGPLPELYIHHTGSPSPAPNLAAEALHMRQLQSYATRPKAQGGKGYSDLDYNLVIGRSGNIYEGRGIDRKSAATLDRNDVSRSICVMGNYQVERVPLVVVAAAIDAGRLMIAGGALSDAGAVIVRGHRDNPAHPGATACPGNNLYAYVPEIAAAIATPPAPPAPNGAPMESIILAITGCNAVFRAFLDYPTEQVILCEWSGPGGTAKTDWMLARAQQLRHVTLDIGELASATLIGPIPAGDTRHVWDGSEFFRVVP